MRICMRFILFMCGIGGDLNQGFGKFGGGEKTRS